jgi:PKD repeat protein
LATSSRYGPQWDGDKALDGIVTSESKWTSSNTTPPHWLAVDLGDEVTVNGYIIRLPGAVPEGDHYNAESIMIQRANSLAGPWQDDVIVNNPDQQSVLNKRYINPKTLRYIRLLVTDPGIDNIARIPEFQIVGVAPAPVAVFSAIPLSGDVPLQVAFADHSIGPVDEYAWSFGDGGSSTASGPAHIYFEPGSYSVSLTVTGPGGSDTMTRTGYITAAQPGGYIGDIDSDGDVDQEDFGHFQTCVTGAGRPVTDPACFKVMFDSDNDIDIDDYGLFQQCMSGANQTPPAACLR